jgi:hypothetical protein
MKFKIKLKGDLELFEDVPIPPEPPVDGWPNQPNDMELLSDYALSDVPEVDGDFPLGDSGWRIIYNVPPGTLWPPEYSPPWANTPKGYTLLIDDPSAPKSPPSVFQFTYPEGMREGMAPSTVYLPLPSWKEEIYFAFWWKPSEPFDLSNNGTKLAFIFNGNNGQQFICMDNQRLICCLPEYVGHVRWLPRVNSTPVELGKWHLVEWLTNCSTGVSKVWLDDILQVEGNDVFNTAELFTMTQLSPTYGGAGGFAKTETDYYYFDHVRVCAREPRTRALVMKTEGYGKTSTEIIKNA